MSATARRPSAPIATATGSTNAWRSEVSRPITADFKAPPADFFRSSPLRERTKVSFAAFGW